MLVILDGEVRNRVIVKANNEQREALKKSSWECILSPFILAAPWNATGGEAFRREMEVMV